MAHISSPLRPLTTALRAFRRDEAGVMTILGVVIFAMMLMAGGIALDFMRFESERAKLQYTLDRGVLAAASLRQEEDRELVVRSYLAAAGIDPELADIDVTEDSGGLVVTSREVAARIAKPIESLFLGLLGVESMTAPAASRAAEIVKNVELSLVLDISSSMRGGKLRELKAAAQRFVTEILSERPDAASISIVPYFGQVNIGPTYAQYFQLEFNGGAPHAFSHCVRFELSDYQTTAIAPSARLRQVAHFDTNWHAPGGSPAGDTEGEIPRPRCRPDRGAPALFSNDELALHQAIDALEWANGTAIDLGVKWGAALLDPSSRQRVADMVRDGHVSAAFAGRPAEFDDAGTMKILVVMTDGANHHQNDIRADRQTGPSGVFAYHPDFPSMTDGEIADFIMSDPSDPDPYDGVQQDITFAIRDFTQPDLYYLAGTSDTLTSATAPEGVVELDFRQLWAIKPHPYVWNTMAGHMPSSVWNYYKTALHDYYDYRPGNTIPDSDDNLASICAAAKQNGVKVFTIGFRVRGRDRAPMRDCASGESNFYDAQHNDLQDAFDQISRVITQLTLTQ